MGIIGHRNKCNKYKPRSDTRIVKSCVHYLSTNDIKENRYTFRASYSAIFIFSSLNGSQLLQKAPMGANSSSTQ